jgi:hypothetical protein
MTEDLTNIKNYCCSCGERMDIGNWDLYAYYERYGNYCQMCNERINRNFSKNIKRADKFVATKKKGDLADFLNVL